MSRGRVIRRKGFGKSAEKQGKEENTLNHR